MYIILYNSSSSILLTEAYRKVLEDESGMKMSEEISIAGIWRYMQMHISPWFQILRARGLP